MHRLKVDLKLSIQATSYTYFIECLTIALLGFLRLTNFFAYLSLGGRSVSWILKKVWVPIALADQLAVGGVMRVVLGERDFATWRGHDGKVRTFDNRCPHRGMRLSHGFVRGNRLSCLYHGWQYGGTGTCKHIPAHPDLTPPEALGATLISSVEFDGLIWLSTTQSAFSKTDAFFGNSVRSLTFDCGIKDLKAQLQELHFYADVEGLEKGYTYLPSDVEDFRLVFQCPSAQKNDVVPSAFILSFTPTQNDKTTLHIQITGSDESLMKIAVSRWAERLRLAVENPNIAHTSLRSTSKLEDVS